MNILALVGLLSMVAMVTEGCSCYGPLHPQQAVCNAALVVRATIGEWKAFSYNRDRVLVEAPTNSYFPDKNRYELKIKDIYRSDGTIDTDTKPFYLYSNPDSGMCGISVESNQEYVISMYLSYDTKVPSANLCSSYVKRWDDLAEETRKNFENQVYVDACKECKVKICPYGCTSGNDTCHFKPYLWTDASCWTEGRCVRQSSGECDWNLKQCRDDERDWSEYGYVHENEIEVHSVESLGDDIDEETEEATDAAISDAAGEQPDVVLSDEIDIEP